jgi:hypothetical protein
VSEDVQMVEIDGQNYARKKVVIKNAFDTPEDI